MLSNAVRGSSTHKHISVVHIYVINSAFIKNYLTNIIARV